LSYPYHSFENNTKEGKSFRISPVKQMMNFKNKIKSKMTNGMCCLNIGVPPSKSKKILTIDSESSTVRER